MLLAFVHGIGLALTLILPLGPQNLFVFSQGLLQPSYRRALPAICAAAASDTGLILTAIIGMSVISPIVEPIKPFLLLAGSVFLVVMGIATWRSSELIQSKASGLALSAGKQVALAFGCSLNPHAFADTIGAIGPTSLSYETEERLAFSVGCIVLSWFWFLGIAAAGRLAVKRDVNGQLTSIFARVSAAMMLFFAVGLACGALAGFSGR